LRLDVHPADLRNPRHMLALEWVLSRSGPRRTAVTYEDLACEEATRTWRPAAPGGHSLGEYPRTGQRGVAG